MLTSRHPSNGPDHPDPVSQLYFYGFEDQIVEVQVLEPRQRMARVPESVVHDIWKRQAFEFADLRTSHNEPVRVYSPGRYNRDAGPDFLDAQILIDGVLWRGDVELHLFSREWYDHRHHENPRYNSTILHATLFADPWTGALLRHDESRLPELVLFPYLKQRLRSLLPAGPHPAAERLPCHTLWPGVSEAVKSSWVEELAAMRLRARRTLVEQAFLQTPDLEALLHRALFVGLGYAKNSEPMADLCLRIPLSLARTLTDPLDLEALHFGVAGLLPYDDDLFHLKRDAADYALELRQRFVCLNERLKIPLMLPQAWRFFRLRPANFPTIRLAQATALLGPKGFLSADPINQLVECFRHPEAGRGLQECFRAAPSSFWQHHYHFKRPAPFHTGTIGPQRVQKLIINAVVPILLVHADQTALPWLEDQLIRHLRSIKAESDEITKRFTRAGARAPDAYTTQGLHELHRRYCSSFGCLECSIGKAILNAG